jgi:TnpA family transposase
VAAVTHYRHRMSMAAAGTRGAGPAGGTAVLVDKKSVAINSQLISCTASEVAAMIEGAMHHRTEMDVQANYVDSHGQSEVGFGLTRLLGSS